MRFACQNGVVFAAWIVMWMGGSLGHGGISFAHDHTLPKFLQARAAAEDRSRQLAQVTSPHEPVCRATVRLFDAVSRQPLAGSLRITRLDTGKAVPLSAAIHRQQQWYSLPSTASLSLPQTRLRIEAVHGLESRLRSQEVDLTGRDDANIEVPLTRLYDPRRLGLVSGNTHLHLMKMSYAEAMRYLEQVPQADGLDLVFLSHLRRVEAERLYISNEIVENALSGQELTRLNQHGTVFGLGQEHRHNFGPGGEGFGHVMLLDIPRLIHPVSIGPGIMGQGTDQQPLRVGIDQARADGATVIWCHDRFGFEDVPNWIAGRLDAVNIGDGGKHGTYADSFYRYLNLGERVPFSTGTDWFVFDFSRVYVPVSAPLTTSRWLAALRRGESYITNGPFLEFEVDGQRIGSTLTLAQSRTVRVRGRAIGRHDFRALELVRNGETVHVVDCRVNEAGDHVAEIDLPLELAESGWLALRISQEAGRNEFDQQLFAHTSPIYVEIARRRLFRVDVARELIREMEANIRTIEAQGVFADDTERTRVLAVHREGIATLQQRLKAAGVE